MNVIEVKALEKNFGQFMALDGLDLSVRKGEVHGLLGPNGSGKSTTIRILLGLLHKNGGEVTLFGEDPWAKAVDLHKRLAYVPGEVNLWPNLSGGESIDFLGRLHGGLDEKRKQELLKRFDLDPKKKFRTYSKGNRQKVAIVAALSSDVELFVLDEPTSGLDPLLETVFQEVIEEIKAQGKTVLLSSHILAEVEALGDRVTIIREGKTVESGSLDEMRQLTNTKIKVTTKKPLKGFEKQKGVVNFEHKDGQYEFEVEADQLEQVLEYLTSHGIKAITSHPPTLQELFLRHYNSDLTEEEMKEAENGNNNGKSKK